MASPEDRDRKRKRMKNKWAKELRTSKYKSKVVEDKKKVLVKDLTHAELIRLLNEEKEGDT
jgi:hypothetical protein